MKIKYLLSACLLLSGLASCTSDEIVPNRGGIDGNVPGHGAVVFSLSGLGTGSVENPSTRATVLATAEENRIDSLDIYVFAFDDDGVFDENTDSPSADDIGFLTPASDAEVTDNTKWYLQEKWTYKSQEPGRSSGVVDTSKPYLHEIPSLGGSGVARTAVIYPKKGRCLKFFIVANGGELTATGADTPWTPDFPGEFSVGALASDFLNLRLRLGLKPAAADQVLPINCPLPMTAQMAATTADMVNMVGDNAPAQSTRPATLTRAVTRFDVVNYAALPSQGDYTLTDVYVTGHYAFTNMQNLIPAGEALKAPVKHNLDGRTWSAYTDLATGERAMMLASVFYTSPTLAGTDPMQLGLRGVLGKTTAKPGELLTPLNKDVKVVDADGNPIVLQANYRYLLNIKKLGSDINVIFSIIDWDSKILDADFSNAPMPKLIWENTQGITWRVTDTDMNRHSVEMANTAVGGRLAFELGTYAEDELADLLIAPTDPTKIPFDVQVLSLNDNPAFPDDNIWLAAPVITFDPVKRDRFNVVLDIRPEVEVPLNIRPDLMVMVMNKEHAEKQLFFRVTSTWVTPEKPVNTVVTINDYNVLIVPANSWQNALDKVPATGNYKMPAVADVNTMAGVQFTATPVTITSQDFLKAFPVVAPESRSAGITTYYWLANAHNENEAYCLVRTGDQASVVSKAKSNNLDVRYIRYETPEYEYGNGAPSIPFNLGGGKTPVYVAPVNTYDEVQFKYANFATDGSGQCPKGWNIPTKAEVKAIFGLSREEYPNEVSTDILNAWPTGTYWTRDREDETSAWAFKIFRDGNVSVEKINHETSAAARCIKIKE